MAKQEKSVGPKTGFVIKLSSETAQKLADEDQEAKSAASKELSEATTSSDVGQSISPQKAASEVTLQVLDQEKTTLLDKPVTSEVSKSDSAKPEENAWGNYAPYITYEGEKAIYTDPSSQLKYNWNKDTSSWDLNEGQKEGSDKVYSYENDTHVYTERDGSKFFWDADKKAWIPKVDDDFLAYYQMSYGFVDNTAPAKDDEGEKSKQDEKKLEAAAGVKRKSEPQWFEPSEETNTKVYVSNLPQDTTEEEFVDLMQKCGLVMRDLATQRMKVKLYTDKEQNCFKGDALCTYIKRESVELALNLLDGSEYKGQKIKVERAHFQLKGDYNPALKPKKKKKKELEKLKKMQEKLFDWRPEKFIGERSKHERVVIIKNLFHPTDFDKEVQLILDYQQDLREECAKCGEVRKVLIYDRHPEGVAQVTMKEPEQADAVIALINGRWFGKKQITAEIWDGKTKYKIAETDADLNQRIDGWEKFLEGGEKSTSDPKTENDLTSKDVTPTPETIVEPEKNTELKPVEQDVEIK